MATRAAIPNMIADINNNRRERFLRLSRQAISKSQGMLIFRFVSKLSISWLYIICFIISHQFAAFYADNALGFGSKIKVMGNKDQGCAGFFI